MRITCARTTSFNITPITATLHTHNKEQGKTGMPQPFLTRHHFVGTREKEKKKHLILDNLLSSLGGLCLVARTSVTH